MNRRNSVLKNTNPIRMVGAPTSIEHPAGTVATNRSR
jgi:hypothetical protein